MKILVLFIVGFIASCSQLTREESSHPVSGNQAVGSLYQDGLQEKQVGNWAAAQATFERALRIEPNNPTLWYELAQLAYQQHNHSEAKALALRAQSYAGDNTRVKRKIDRLLNQLSN